MSVPLPAYGQYQADLRAVPVRAARGFRERCRSRPPSIGMQANPKTSQAIVGVHPDSIEVTWTAGLTGTPIKNQDWATLAQMVHEAGERS